MPVALAYLNSNQITLWLLTNSILAISVLFEGSISVVFTRMLSARYAQHESSNHNDKRKLHEFIIGVFLIYAAASVISAFAGLYSARFAIIGIANGLNHQEDTWSPFLFASCMMVSILLAFFRSVKISQGGIRQQRMVQLAFAIVKLAATPVIFYAYKDVATYLIFFTISTGVEFIVSVSLVRADFLAACRSTPSGASLKEFWRPFWMTSVVRVGGYLTLYSTSLIVVRYAPLESAAYLLSFRLVQALNSVSLIPLSVALPRLARLRVGTESSAKLRHEFIQISINLIALSSGLFTIGAILLNIALPILPHVISTKGSQFSQSFTLYLCLIFLFECHHVGHAMIYETKNKVPFLWIATISGSLITIGSIIAVPAFGAWGAIIVINVVQLCGNNWYSVYLNLQEWHMNFKDYLSHIKESLLTGSFATEAARD